jgi:hypothetical protein
MWNFRALLNHMEDEEMTSDYVLLEAVVEEDKPETLEQFADKIPAVDYSEITKSMQRTEERGAWKSRVRAASLVAIAMWIAAFKGAARRRTGNGDWSKRWHLSDSLRHIMNL